LEAVKEGKSTAAAKAKATGQSINLVRGEAEELPFPDASFDAVVSTLVLCRHLICFVSPRLISSSISATVSLHLFSLCSRLCFLFYSILVSFVVLFTFIPQKCCIA